MLNPVDRTGEFLAALASHHGISSPQSASALVRQPDRSSRHAFTLSAEALTGRISAMRQFTRKCARRYEDFSARGMSDDERDEIDSAVGQFLRDAMGQIEALKTEAVREVEQRRGGSFAAHKLGVVVVLNEDLQGVSTAAERLRGVRIGRALREKGRVGVSYDAGVARELAAERREREEREGGEEAAEMEVLRQEFERENVALVGELVETRERVREAERTVFEIANLNHVFATKVLEQAREIEVLYELAVEATGHVERGNRELRKMKRRGPVLQYGFAAFAVFLTLAILFLDWIASRRSLFFL